MQYGDKLVTESVLKADLAELKYELLKWVVGIIGVYSAIVFAIAKGLT